MRSSKSRSRNKSNRQRSLGNIVNRVFDSSGPEGKVRGTPQQIIEKYLALARDAQLSNDRVAEQSFFQHAEHYTRLLSEAQREQAERQQHQASQRDDAGQRDDDRREDGGEQPQQRHPAQNGGGQNGGGQGGGNGQPRHRPDQQPRFQPDQPPHAQARPDETARGDGMTNPRDHRQPAAREDTGRPAAMAAATSAPEGLPPAITTDEEAGPVETPESAAGIGAEATTPAPVETASAVADETAVEAAAEASGEPSPQDAPQETPRAAPRRRTTTRSTTAAPRATTTRSRKKPADSDPAASKEPASEG